MQTAYEHHVFTKPRVRCRCALWVYVAIACASWPASALARLVIDKVVVEGNPKSTRSTIMAQAHLFPDEPVDMAVLNSARDSLLGTGLYTRAEVGLDMPTAQAVHAMYLDERTHRVTVRVRIVEKQSWVIVPNGSIGAGDQAAGVLYADQNFLGKNQQLAAAAQIGEIRSYALAAFQTALHTIPPVEFALAVAYRRTRFRFFDRLRPTTSIFTRLTTADARFTWVVVPDLKLSLGTNVFQVTLDEARSLDSSDEVPYYNSREGNNIAFKIYLVYQHLRAPKGFTQGVRFHIKNEIADSLWRSDFDYAKFDFRIDLCGQLFGTFPSLSFSSVFIYPTSNKGVPLTSVLRLGGASLRGYQVDQFYGDTLMALQLEEQIPVRRNVKIPLVDIPVTFAVAAFVDSGLILDRHPGGVAFSPTNPTFFQLARKLSNFEIGAGGGLRLVLPGIAIPAFKLDVGYGFRFSKWVVSLSIASGPGT